MDGEPTHHTSTSEVTGTALQVGCWNIRGMEVNGASSHQNLIVILVLV